MNRLRKILRALSVLFMGVFSRQRRGEEWKRLTEDRYPYIMALFAVIMLIVVVRIVLFIFSADGAVYREMARVINPPRPRCEVRSMTERGIP